MIGKYQDYPNKEDFKPRIDKNMKDTGELPLSDPAESNATETFRENEAKEDERTDKKSAFGQNKDKKLEQ